MDIFVYTLLVIFISCSGYFGFKVNNIIKKDYDLKFKDKRVIYENTKLLKELKQHKKLF